MSVMSNLALLRSERPRCACCGTTGTLTGTPPTTIVIDWRIELMCDSCISRFDWSDWIFDPILNLYLRK